MIPRGGLRQSNQEQYPEDHHSFASVPHSINFGLRQGIELIDGLLLYGKPIEGRPQVYEVNLETPHTLQILYQKYPSFIRQSYVPSEIEQYVKESFQGADWDCDDEVEIANRIHPYLLLSPSDGASDPQSGKHGKGTFLTPAHSSSSHLSPSTASTPFLHRWPTNPFMKLTDTHHNKQFSFYTLIKSIDLLYSKSTPKQIMDYRQYSKRFQHYIQQLAKRSKDTRADDSLEDRSSHRSGGNRTSTCCEETETRCTPIPCTRANSNSLGSVTMCGSCDPHHHSLRHSHAPDEGDFHSLPQLPESLDDDVRAALSYQANNHNMFCLTIRNVTDTLSCAVQTATPGQSLEYQQDNQRQHEELGVPHRHQSHTTPIARRVSPSVASAGAVSHSPHSDAACFNNPDAYFGHDIIQNPQGYAMIMPSKQHSSDHSTTHGFMHDPHQPSLETTAPLGQPPISGSYLSPSIRSLSEQQQPHATSPPQLPLSSSPICGIVFGRLITADEMLKWAKTESVLDPQLMVSSSVHSSSSSIPSLSPLSSSQAIPHVTTPSSSPSSSTRSLTVLPPEDISDPAHTRSEMRDWGNNSPMASEPRLSFSGTRSPPSSPEIAFDTAYGMKYIPPLSDHMEDFSQHQPLSDTHGLSHMSNSTPLTGSDAAVTGQEQFLHGVPTQSYHRLASMLDDYLDITMGDEQPAVDQPPHGQAPSSSPKSETLTISGLDATNVEQLAHDAEEDLSKQKSVVFYIPIHPPSAMCSTPGSSTSHEHEEMGVDASRHPTDSENSQETIPSDSDQSHRLQSPAACNSSIVIDETEQDNMDPICLMPSLDQPRVHTMEQRFMELLTRSTSSQAASSPLSSSLPSLPQKNYQHHPKGTHNEALVGPSPTTPTNSPGDSIRQQNAASTGSIPPPRSSTSSSTAPPQHWVKIELIATLPEHQNRGIATLLLISSFLASMLSTRLSPFPNSQRINHSILNIAGGHNNIAATTVYRRLGFVPIDQTLFDSPNRDLFILFRIDKTLAKIRWDELIAGLHSAG